MDTTALVSGELKGRGSKRILVQKLLVLGRRVTHNGEGILWKFGHKKKKKGEEAIEVKNPKNKTVSKNQKTNQPINQTPKDTIY